jgi:Uma2 family endonuclease
MSVIVDGKLKLTYQEYRRFPDDGNTHELIDGEHVMAPAPGTNHQSVSRHIQFQLYAQLEQAGEAQIIGPPDLVVEIISPSTRERDRELRAFHDTVRLSLGTLRATVDLTKVW